MDATNVEDAARSNAPQSDATQSTASTDALRRQRLQDPQVRNNGYCEKCEFRGYIPLWDGTDTVRSCECAIKKLVAQRLDKVGVPKRWRGMAFDTLLQTEAMAEDIRPNAKALRGLKEVFVQHLDAINSGRLFSLGSDLPPMRSLALIGGIRRLKSAWAAQVVEEKGTHSGAFAWYSFSELRAMLSDFKRLGEAAEFVEVMGSYNFVVIDGIHGGQCAPGFPAAWDAAIAARQNLGQATILLCEENHAIDSYAWKDMLDDPHTLVLPFRSTAQIDSAQANSTAQVSSSSQAQAKGGGASTPQREVKTQEIKTQEIATQDAAETAILDYLGKNPDKIIKMIYGNIPAPQELVKAALDSLMSTGDVLKRQKSGKGGTMTVFYLRPEDGETVTPTVSKQMTLSELQEKTGIPRTTLWRYRNVGQSDEEIIRRAEAG